MESYQDLRVWQMGMEIAKQCYLLTRRFPREEVFGLTSQIRRAATSVPANIAEGFGRNRRGDYANFLRIAQGSLKELETHLMISVNVEICSEEATRSILSLCDDVGRMLSALIRSVEANFVKEEAITYNSDSAPEARSPNSEALS